ncbi:MAG: hypothetical protein ACTSRS_18900 [Candidatus Helarchaeota archaeon]
MDQNIWIELLKVYVGKKNDSEIHLILAKLYKLIKQHKILIPINLTNIIEGLKRRILRKKIEWILFLQSFTRGFSFKPWTSLVDLEILNFANRLLNRSEVDVREYAVGQGIEYLFNTESKEQINEKEFDIYLYLLESAYNSAFHISNTRFEEINQKFNKNLIESQRIIETRREELRAMSNKIQRNRYDGFQLNSFIIPRLLNLSLEHNLPIEKVIPFNINADLGLEILKHLPLIYTNFALYSARDRHWNRSLKLNDFYDICSLCFAIPYTDVVVGEKFFISIAKNAHLDKLYNTVLLTKIQELNPYLDQIL